ncbi:MAG: cytochrome c peroxidase [Saprospiraceae bacterium]
MPVKATLNPLTTHAALPKTVIDPRDNISTDEKVELGRLLFYDPILSGDKDVACATCHHPDNGYAEYRDLSIGVNGTGLGFSRTFKQPNTIPFVKRNAHTILNTAFNGIKTTGSYHPDQAPMFWDLRVNSLEKQAIEPILAFEEMRGTHFSEAEIIDVVVNRLKRIPAYVALFESVFEEPESITEDNIAKAIAAFERTLVTTETRFDQYMRGDKKAISISEREGFLLFKKVGCGNCHNGPMFSDYLPHVIGVPTNDKLLEFDKGIEDQYAFRTASLRNLRFTAPYMHNGRFNSLREVLEFYEDISNGKNIHVDLERQQLDTLIQQIDMSVKEIGPIISFLNTLNDTNFDKAIPESVPSGLSVGGDIR